MRLAPPTLLLALLGLAACGSSPTAGPPGDGSRERSSRDGSTPGDQAPPGPDLDPSSCRAIDSCLYGCSTTDKSCIDACLAPGSTDAKAKLTAMNACQQTQIQGPCASSCAALDLRCGLCMDPACAKEIAACFGVALGGTGSRTCPEAHGCLAACRPADTLCVKHCFYAATADAQGKLVALESCNRTALLGGCQTACVDLQSTACAGCLATACKSESTACFGK
jgi:hypothetical protein